MSECVKCPDCQQGEIWPGGQCPVCGLTWEAIEDAAAFLCSHGFEDSDDCGECRKAAAPHGGF